jgi:choline-sulfatase
MLGDHDLWSKRHPDHGSVGVPLVLSGPAVRRGLTLNAPATTLDLTATFLDYAGVARPEGLDSRSLRPVLSGRASSVRDHVLSGMDAWRLVEQDRFKYIRTADKPPMLFDLRDDPGELVNLASDRPQLAARLEKLLPRTT